MIKSASVFAVLAAAGLAASAFAQVVPARLVARVGQPINGADGSTVSALNTPFTTLDGRVVFTGTLSLPDDSTTGFVYRFNRVVWQNTQAPSGFTITGAEASSGGGTFGRWAFSPSIVGGFAQGDGIWSSEGLVTADQIPAPGYPGLFIAFASRPSMFGADGLAFVAGYSATAGGATAGRIFYRGTIPIPGQGSPTLTPVFRSGDVVAGFPLVSNGGINFNYKVSDSGQHQINDLILVIGGTNTNCIVVNNTIAIQRGTPVPGSNPVENWENTNAVGINNDGTYIVGGDTNAATSADAFLAVNGVPVIREGQTVDGVSLVAGSAVRVAAINNAGQVAHIWTVGTATGSPRHLFLGDASDLAATSRRILSHGDQIDTTGDGIADFDIVTIEGSTVVTAGIDLAENGAIYLQVTISPAGTGETPTNAIIHLCPACDGLPRLCVGDWDGNGEVEPIDIRAFFDEYRAGTADPDGNGEVEPLDISVFFAAFRAGC